MLSLRKNDLNLPSKLDFLGQCYPVQNEILDCYLAGLWNKGELVVVELRVAFTLWQVLGKDRYG
tara:strand:+ start:182 stop:373 length:192 start_codon:yes stop_codon:yes gene_type:complete